MEYSKIAKRFAIFFSFCVNILLDNRGVKMTKKKIEKSDDKTLKQK